MKVLVISIWGLCTTKGEVRLQVLVSPMEGTRLYKGMIRAAGELDCFSAHIRLREPNKSEDKAEVVYHQGRSQIASTSESHGGDSIIQRYDRSSWRVGLLQYSHSLKGARQVRGQSQNCKEDTVMLKQVIERGEEATTSPVGLSYPKAKRRSERRWTWRSTIVPQRQIYRSRRKG
ncbi:hypothetical protein BHM03_00051599 [Ensete ventricosum]|nr:hypothetical protein BHM03_00051599 [Ensete ventricosum]